MFSQVFSSVSSFVFKIQFLEFSKLRPVRDIKMATLQSRLDWKKVFSYDFWQFEHFKY